MLKKYHDLVILSIIWIVSIYSLTISILNHYEIGIPNYIGYALLIGITILRIIKIRKVETVIGIFLILGSFNLFQFTHSTVTLFFTISIFGHGYSSIGLQPLSFVLLVLFIIMNFSVIQKLIKKYFGADPKIELERQQDIETRFYEELKDTSDSDLAEIIRNKDDYQLEYVRAAQKLLSERKILK